MWIFFLLVTYLSRMLKLVISHHKETDLSCLWLYLVYGVLTGRYYPESLSSKVLSHTQFNTVI